MLFFEIQQATFPLAILSVMSDITYGQRNSRRRWWKISLIALSFVLVNQSVIHSTWRRILTQILYLCELLATGKYRETKKFHVNVTFHHFSPWVSDIL